MTIAAVSGQGSGTQRSGQSSSALTITYTNPTSSGNLLILTAAYFGTSTLAVTDNKGNTWTQACTSINGSLHADIWYTMATTGGSSHTITVTPTGSVYLSLGINEYSGVASSPLLGTATNAANYTAAITTRYSNTLQIAVIDVDAGGAGITSESTPYAWTSVYTQTATGSTEGIGFQSLGESSPLLAGTYCPYWTESSACASAYAMFKSADSVLVSSPRITETTPRQAQGINRSGSLSSALTITYANPTVVGNLLVLGVCYNGAASVTVTDNKGNTWGPVVASTNGTQHAEIWATFPTTGGSSHTITITPNSGTYLSVAINEYFANGQILVVDQTSFSSGNSTTPTSGPITTANSGELYLGLMNVDSSFTGMILTNTWEEVYTLTPAATTTGISLSSLGDLYAQPAGTYAATWLTGTSHPWAAALVVFKFAASTDALYRNTTTGKLNFVNAKGIQHLSGYPSCPLTTLDDSSFSWDNQESRTISYTNGYTSLHCPVTNATNLGSRYKSKTGTYTITVLVNQVSFTGQAFVIGWRESSSGKSIIFGNSYVHGLRIIKQNTMTSYNSDYASSGMLNSSIFLTNAHYWLQIQDDGTNRICRISSNGYNFVTIHSVSRTDFMTADQVLYGNGSDGHTDCYMNILSWIEGA